MAVANRPPGAQRAVAHLTVANRSPTESAHEMRRADPSSQPLFHRIFRGHETLTVVGELQHLTGIVDMQRPA